MGGTLDVVVLAWTGQFIEPKLKQSERHADGEKFVRPGNRAA